MGSRKKTKGGSRKPGVRTTKLPQRGDPSVAQTRGLGSPRSLKQGVRPIYPPFAGISGAGPLVCAKPGHPKVIEQVDLRGITHQGPWPFRPRTCAVVGIKNARPRHRRRSRPGQLERSTRGCRRRLSKARGSVLYRAQWCEHGQAVSPTQCRLSDHRPPTPRVQCDQTPHAHSSITPPLPQMNSSKHGALYGTTA